MEDPAEGLGPVLLPGAKEVHSTRVTRVNVLPTDDEPEKIFPYGPGPPSPTEMVPYLIYRYEGRTKRGSFSGRLSALPGRL